MLFNHELLRPSLSFPFELDRLSIVGRFGWGLAPFCAAAAAGVGVEGAAGVVSLAGCAGVGGVTTAGDWLGRFGVRSLGSSCGSGRRDGMGDVLACTKGLRSAGFCDDGGACLRWCSDIPLRISRSMYTCASH